MNPIVIYHGPSEIDGSPIVVLATVSSKNRKTGTMIQTAIMRADMAPHDAKNNGHDVSICGLCPRRHFLGGDCYVLVQNAPLSTWRHWDRAGRPGENWADPENIIRLYQDGKDSGLRLGYYGDPAAVPYTVWQDLIDAIQPKYVVGYTHQWRHLDRPVSHPTIENISQLTYRIKMLNWYRNNVMASCDSVNDAMEARQMGWRYFLAVPSKSNINLPERTILCPATVSERTCSTCGACSGADRGSYKASIYVEEHGVRSMGKRKRSAMLAVVQ